MAVKHEELQKVLEDIVKETREHPKALVGLFTFSKANSRFQEIQDRALELLEQLETTNGASPVPSSLSKDVYKLENRYYRERTRTLTLPTVLLVYLALAFAWILVFKLPLMDYVQQKFGITAMREYALLGVTGNFFISRHLYSNG
jgi:hypothetical protein